MLYLARTARIPAIDRLATLPRLHIEWSVSAQRQTVKSQVSDVVGLGALLTAIVVLCTCVLSAVLSAVFMLVS
jgi:hypothetical protein